MLDIDHRVFVAGTGSYVPDRVVTNEALEDLVRNYDESESGPFPEWIDRVTHIRERRILDFDGSSGDMAREACRIALDEAGVDPAEIGLFVMATFTTKNLYPGEETLLAHEFGMKGAATFYLTAACAGSVYALQTAYAFLKAGFYRHALVVGTEHLTSVVDWADPVTAILFGDGAGAAVLSRRDEDGPGGVVPRCVLGSNFVPGNITMDNTNCPPRSHVHTLNGTGGPRELAERQYIHMAGGPRVLRTAVNTMAEATVKSLGFTMRDLKRDHPELRALLEGVRVVPHQANGRIIDGLTERLGIRDSQMYKTIYRYGNISAASNLVTLDHAVRKGNMVRVAEEGRPVVIEDDADGRIRPGDLVAIPTVGAGYLTGCFTYVAE